MYQYTISINEKRLPAPDIFGFFFQNKRSTWPALLEHSSPTAMRPTAPRPHTRWAFTWRTPLPRTSPSPWAPRWRSLKFPPPNTTSGESVKATYCNILHNSDYRYDVIDVIDLILALILFHSPRLSPAQYSLTVQTRDLKHQSCHFSSWSKERLSKKPRLTYLINFIINSL